MSEVIRLNTPPNNMIATVEHLLERVKAGEISALAIAGVCANEDAVVSAVHAETGIFSLLGTLDHVMKLIEAKIER